MKTRRRKLFLAVFVVVLVSAIFVVGNASNFLGSFRSESVFSRECRDKIDNDGDGYIDLNGCDCNSDGEIDTSIGSQSALRKILCEAAPKSVISGYNSSCTLQSGTWYDADPNCGSKFDNSEDEDHCSDGIYNEGEEGLDCGWTCSNECVFTEKDGEITSDETWSGNVYVGYVEVAEGVTLTIEPGTIVKFKYDRDYKTMDRGDIRVSGGDIIAVGTPEQPIWFTSSAPDPINGDWNKISVDNSDNSEFDYIILEYAEMGISQDTSDAPITNSIVRWTNSEGLYAERSEPYFEGNLLYGNGYHEIALEQYNTNVVTINNIFRDGHRAIHHEKTENYISGNCFISEPTTITAGMDSSLEITGNLFYDFDVPLLSDTSEDFTVNEDYLDVNYFDDNSFVCPSLNFEDITNFELNYIPGDDEDEFIYVYDEEDETRRVLNMIGEDLSFGWALEYVDEHLYRFSLGNGEVGDGLDFIKIDPSTGEYELFGSDDIMNARGLTWDGEYFYVNDFSLLQIFKFELNENDGEITIVDSFDIPEPDLGGVNGLTTDGTYLYLRSRDGEFLYKMTKDGTWVDQLYIPGVSVIWTGEYFWVAGGACDKNICKYTADGELVGSIYEAAKDTWAITWDGEYLWTIQRTCEGWDDPKIYQIEVLDDSLSTGDNSSSDECVDYEEYILIGSDAVCCEGLIPYDCSGCSSGDYCCDEGEFICL